MVFVLRPGCGCSSRALGLRARDPWQSLTNLEPFSVFFGTYIKCIYNIYIYIYLFTYVDIFVMYTTVLHLCQIFCCTAKEWVNQTFFQSTVEWIDHVVGTCLRGLGTLDSPWIILGS